MATLPPNNGGKNLFWPGSLQQASKQLTHFHCSSIAIGRCHQPTDVLHQLNHSTGTSFSTLISFKSMVIQLSF